MQLASIHGTSSFISNSNATPDRVGLVKTSDNASPEQPNPTDSTISQGNAIISDQKIGEGLQAVLEAKSDNGDSAINEDGAENKTDMVGSF